MKDLQKRAARALVALLQNDAKTALEELNVYKIKLEDGEPILTPGHMLSEVWDKNPHPLAGREMWAVGIDKGKSTYGMTNGPFPTLQEALDICGVADAVLVHYFGDGTDEVTHYWKADHWESI